MDRSGPDRGEATESIPGYLVGGLGPILVAAALVAVRNDIESTTQVLILVVVVVLAAIAGGRSAGATAAVLAALSFDFFLTRPYLSLRIDSAADLETTFVLLVIGVLVGEIVVRGRRSRRAADRAAEEIGRIRRVARQAASGVPVDDLILSVEAELAGLLELSECTFSREAPEIEMPRLERTGTIRTAKRTLGSGGEFALPEDGVELLVIGGGRILGRFLMEPTRDRGASLESRVVAVALADQLGAVMANANAPEA